LTWLEWGGLAFIGGIYNANVFDRDIITTLQGSIKDNYSNYVMGKLDGKLKSAFQSVGKKSEASDLNISSFTEKKFSPAL